MSTIGPIPPLGTGALAAAVTPASIAPIAATPQVSGEAALLALLDGSVGATISEALNTQDSLAPLLANLATAGASPALSPAARDTIAQILRVQTPLDASVTAETLASAVKASGLFMEASLGAAIVSPGSPPPDLTGDLKALLLQLTTQLAPAAAAEAAAVMAQPAPTRGSARAPPPVRGGPLAGQGAVRATLDAEADGPTLAHGLHQDARAALGRLQLSQLASLPEPDATTTRWAFEAPVATPAGAAMAQFEISRDGGSPSSGGDAKSAPPVWRARFSLAVEPTGPVHAEVTLVEGRARVTLWVERDGARQRLAADQTDLADALTSQESPDVAVRVLAGAPAPPDPQAGQLLDRRS